MPQTLEGPEVAGGDLCVDSATAEESLAVFIILCRFNIPPLCLRSVFAGF